MKPIQAACLNSLSSERMALVARKVLLGRFVVFKERKDKGAAQATRHVQIDSAR
jgi:hypothetical protein